MSDVVDRHFLLQHMAESAYKLRNDRQDALTWCEWACWQWLMEAPILIEGLRTEFSGEFVHISIPKRLVIHLEKGGEAARAVDVAQACQGIGLKPEDEEYLRRKAQKLEARLTKD